MQILKKKIISLTVRYEFKSPIFETLYLISSSLRNLILLVTKIIIFFTTFLILEIFLLRY